MLEEFSRKKNTLLQSFDHNECLNGSLTHSAKPVKGQNPMADKQSEKR